MLPQWVPSLKPWVRSRKNFDRGSLSILILAVLLLGTLLPMIILGTLNNLRARSLMRDQASQTLTGIVANETNQMDAMVAPRGQALDALAKNTSFHDALNNLIKLPESSGTHQQAAKIISSQFQAIKADPGNLFDQIFILRPDGTVATASDYNWATKTLGNEAVPYESLRDLIGKNETKFVYNPFLSYANEMILFSARSFVNDSGAPLATLIATTKSEQFYNVISPSNAILPYATSSFFTSEGYLVGKSAKGHLEYKSTSEKLKQELQLLTIGLQKPQSGFGSSSFQGEPILVSAHWIPEYNLGITTTLPEARIISGWVLFTPFNMVLGLIMIAFTGGLILFSARQVINPLTQVAKSIEQFAKGDRTQRLRIFRSDEIGTIASSFNSIADSFSQFSLSLEEVIENRTSQLRIASEIAQLAYSTANLNDTLGYTVALIAQRFGFYHVAIYLYNETRKTLELREASGFSDTGIKERGDRIDADEETLISLVAKKNAPKIIANSGDDPLFRAHELLPDTHSEVAIPITIGSEVLGVLDVQSTIVDAFDSGMVSVFQTLTNQISSTLQTLRLLESTQLSFQETALLYKATRQVTQAHNENEMIQNLTDTFIQLPFLGAVLSADRHNFKIMVITDPANGRVEKGLQSLNIPVGKMANLLAENRIVLINDISEASEYENLLFFLVRRSYKAAALVSVVENGAVSKVLVLGSQKTNTFTTSRLQPFVNLAEVIGASLEKYRVLNTLQARLAELQIMASFSQAISAETNLVNLYHVLHQQAMQTFGPEMEFAIALYNEQENLIEFPYFYEDRKLVNIPPSKLGQGLTSILIESQKPLLLTDEQAIRAKNPLISGKSPKSWMGVPLIFAGRVVGAVIVQDLELENRFTQDDLNLFLTLAPQIATSVRNAQLYTETQQALRAYDLERYLLNTLLQNIPDGISFKDVNARYTRTSESLARIYGMQADDIIGKTDFDLLDRETAEKIFRTEQMAINLAKPEIGLIEHTVSSDGNDNWTHTSRIPVQTPSGDPYGLLIIQRDITELKLAESLAQRRADQVLTAAEIARDTTGTLDVKTLLQKSVNLVRERFGYYHASIFLLDSAGEYAVLRESTGMAGQQMMETGHRLAVGSKSIVGQVTGDGIALIVNDVTSDPTHLPNPLLPDTRSELAIPLKVGERILGALDVQSIQANAFNTEDIGVLQILADQMAVAVVNGELFEKTQELLGKHRLLRQITIEASISTSLEEALLNVVSGLRTAMVGDRIAILLLNSERQLQVQASSGYEGTLHLEARVTLGQGIIGQAAAGKQTIRVDDVLSDPRYIAFYPEVRSELAIPILFSDELIGVLDLESNRLHAYDENDQEILGALGNNLGGVIANIRLVTQVRQQVANERQLFEVTSKIRRSVDLETILETSAKEIARALGANRASIRITAGDMPILLESTDSGAGSTSGAGNTSGVNGFGKGLGNQNGQEK